MSRQLLTIDNFLTLQIVSHFCCSTPRDIHRPEHQAKFWAGSCPFQSSGMWHVNSHIWLWGPLSFSPQLGSSLKRNPTQKMFVPKCWSGWSSEASENQTGLLSSLMGNTVSTFHNGRGHAYVQHAHAFPLLALGLLVSG